MSLWALLSQHNASRVRRIWRTSFVAVIAAILAIALASSFSPTTAQSQLPEPQIHSLPDFAQNWPQVEDDYFDEVQVTPLGYLVWSVFPVKVYVDQPQGLEESETKKFEQWIKAVRRAIVDWQAYFPLLEVENPSEADITVLRQRPPRNIQVDRENQRLIIPDQRHGTARYEFYLQPTDPPQVAHRFKISLSPAQNAKHTRGPARHELGHALGIWGHSPDQDDIMFEQQVYKPPRISDRDLSVLRRIYEQPTQLGWQVSHSVEPSP